MKSICLISGSSPEFLGGISLYQRNLIEYSKKNKLKLNFTWVYPGNENKKYKFEGINCIEIKSSKYPFLKEFDFARKARKIISKENFDIINTNANWGYALKNYKKKKDQKIIHTYHGTTYPYMKIQLRRFRILKRVLLSPILLLSYVLEKSPIKKADKIICVSEKVKKELARLFKTNKKMEVIRTGVGVSQFKKLSKQDSRKTLNLDNKKIYGLYSGRGGYWNKGLDRAINLSKEIHKINKNYKLIVVGADKNKCKKYLDFPFVEYKGLIKREVLPKYYSACNFFFFLSRYEGGAPALALSEAIASECLTICSKDSKQEILQDKRDCLILDNYGIKEAKSILELLGEHRQMEGIKKSAKEKIMKFTLDKWGKKYFGVLE